MVNLVASNTLVGNFLANLLLPRSNSLCIYFYFPLFNLKNSQRSWKWNQTDINRYSLSVCVCVSWKASQGLWAGSVDVIRTVGRTPPLPLTNTPFIVYGSDMFCTIPFGSSYSPSDAILLMYYSSYYLFLFLLLTPPPVFDFLLVVVSRSRFKIQHTQLLYFWIECHVNFDDALFVCYSQISFVCPIFLCGNHTSEEGGKVEVNNRDSQNQWSGRRKWRWPEIEKMEVREREI